MVRQDRTRSSERPLQAASAARSKRTRATSHRKKTVALEAAFEAGACKSLQKPLFQTRMRCNKRRPRGRAKRCSSLQVVANIAIPNEDAAQQAQEDPAGTSETRGRAPPMPFVSTSASRWSVPMRLFL